MEWIEPVQVIDLLRSLIRIPSVVNVHPEGAIAKFIADYLRENGAEVTVEDVLPERPNVLGRVGGDSRRLLFNAHMDVVPPGIGWTHDPFGAEMRDDVIYGRGAVDDKGSLAAMLAATAALARSGVRLNGQLVMCAVMDEEDSSKGSKQLMTYLRGDMGIVGEPTNGEVVIAHKGSLRPLLRTSGRLAHTSTPEAGINAISKMAKVVQEIDAFHLELRKRTHPLTGAASAAISMINGGEQSNVIPDTCTALLDRRMIPGEKEADALAELELLFERLNAEDSDLRVMIDHLVPTTGGAAETPADSDVVRLVTAAVEEVFGSMPKLTGLGGACDMVHLVNAGVPTVVFGPGNPGQAHQPNEYILAEELVKAAQVYARVAVQYLS